MKIVVMGVSGCGKSTLGAGLAAALGCAFLDGDDLHPAANIAKMAAGQPLDDADRWPWLAAIGAVLATEAKQVVACSALKRAYRDAIRTRAPDVVFVHVHGARPLLAARLAARTGHYMPAGLLDSQLAALEPPGADEAAVLVDLAGGPDAQCAVALAGLRRMGVTA